MSFSLSLAAKLQITCDRALSLPLFFPPYLSERGPHRSLRRKVPLHASCPSLLAPSDTQSLFPVPMASNREQ